MAVNTAKSIRERLGEANGKLPFIDLSKCPIEDATFAITMRPSQWECDNGDPETRWVVLWLLQQKELWDLEESSSSSISCTPWLMTKYCGGRFL